MSDMNEIVDIHPWIRAAHHYSFHFDHKAGDAGRHGYCYAFHFVTSGKGKIIVPPYSYAIKKGDLIFIPPRTEHSFHYERDDRLSTYNVYCDLWELQPKKTNVHLSWDHSLFDEMLLTKFVRGTELDRLPTVNPLHNHSELGHIFVHIVRQHQRNSGRSGLIANQLLKAFVLDLIEVSQSTSFVDPRIKAVMDTMEKEAHIGFQYENWLSMIGLKKTQFHQLFRRAANMSPKAFLTTVIMKQAAIALEETNISITALADSYGYSSIHHFTKQFTAYYGISPSQFRKNLLQDMSYKGRSLLLNTQRP
jgi:AraC-like DNA-binding protein